MKIVLNAVRFGFGTSLAKLTQATFKPLAKLQIAELLALDVLAVDVVELDVETDVLELDVEVDDSPELPETVPSFDDVLALLLGGLAPPDEALLFVPLEAVDALLETSLLELEPAEAEADELLEP